LAGRYRLERELGQGGMATVYLARDLRHERAVALKVLRPELAQALGADRFLREIRTTAQLTHPHILPLHDSGEAAGFLYYVMPYVEGESLRDRLLREKQLPLDDALQLTREVADALSYAHAHGVVHRDIKPENILLESGHAVVADFGIAKAIAAAGSERLTETGLAIGTPAYMSPEQAAGESDLDGRSDLYSLGCVLYEMLAGEPPFTGPSAQAVVAKRLSTPAPRISILRDTVPAGIEATLNKALARTPADRWVTAADFAAALAHPETMVTPPAPVSAVGTTPAPGTGAAVPVRWSRRRLALLGFATVIVIAAAIAVGRWLRPGASGSRDYRTAIAVLPLENLSAEGPHSYFAGGLHDELLTQLAKVAALSVRARTSVMGYAGTTKSIREIAHELSVGTIVEGSVQVVGERLRVNVQLIDAASDEHLWAERYDRTLDDAFAVQSEIAQRIVEAVGATLTRAEAGAIAAAPTANAEAYRLYLQGEEYRLRPCCEPRILETAQLLYERALALDTGFALAHASLSFVHGITYFLNYDPRQERAARQRAEAETALRLAPGLPQAHLAMGVSHFQAHNGARSDLRQALREFQVAAEGMPGSAEVWQWVSATHAMLGDWDAWQSAFERATTLDPRNADLILQTGNGFWQQHRYGEAVAAFNRGSALAPHLVWPKTVTALVYVLWQGRLDTLRAVAEHVGCAGDENWSTMCVQLALWERRPDTLLALVLEARRVIFEVQDAYEPALLYAAWAHQLRGDSAAMRRAFGGALALLDSALRKLPEDWRIHASRGLALAGLGQRADAKQEADWLLAPAESLGVMWAQWRRTSAALILAQARFTDAALAELERL
jgi:serine/threonine-protein kinase